MEITLAIIFAGSLVFLAHLFTGLFEKTRIPDVLPLVFIGLFVGPILGLVSPETFGKAGPVFTMLTLIVILFQGGLELNFRALQSALLAATCLTLANFVLTVTIFALLSPLILRISFLHGLMLGTIVGGTSSAIVIPMVAKFDLREKTRTILVLESTLSDVICIVVTLALLSAIKQNTFSPMAMFSGSIVSFAAAAVIGGIAAILWSVILEKIRRLENNIFTTLAFGCIIFGMSELLGFSGPISALSFGIVLGNTKNLSIPIFNKLPSLRIAQLNETERTLFSEIYFILKTFFFLYIGISIRLNNIRVVIAGAFFTFIIFAVRIPVIRATLTKNTKKLDAVIASVMIPKGLAAAVLGSLPFQAGIKNGEIIQSIVYSIILFSIVTTTLLTFLLSKGFLERPYFKIFSRYAEDNLQA